jgi:hypothetical protein
MIARTLGGEVVIVERIGRRARLPLPAAIEFIVSSQFHAVNFTLSSFDDFQVTNDKVSFFGNTRRIRGDGARDCYLTGREAASLDTAAGAA